MTKNLERPVIDIEGIGPAIAARLRTVGVTHVADLLFVRPEIVHEAADRLCSPRQVEAWRRMAILMQAEEITPQWAEALVRQGADSPEAVSLLSPAKLADLFAAAAERRIIADAPDAATIGRIRTAAAVLHWSGALLGEVADEAGRPVAGVRVVLGAHATTTDAAGRYRLGWIKGGAARSPLWLKKAGYRTAKEEPAPVVWDDLLHRVRRHVLVAVPAGQEALERQSEFDGDPVTDMGGCGVRVAEVEPARLRDGDIFRVTDFYTRWPQAKLISRFRDYVDGEMIVYKVRYPRDQIPSDIRLGDFLLFYRGKMYRYPEFGPEKHSLLTSVRRFQRENPAPPQNAEEFRARMAALVHFVYQNRQP